MVTGQAAIASKMPMKSSRWNGSRRSSAFFRRLDVVGQDHLAHVGIRSSPKNMCSVRHRPIPSAPNSRALAASAGVSALVRTLSVRDLSAHAMSVAKSPRSSGSTGGTLADHHVAGGAVDRDELALARPPRARP